MVSNISADLLADVQVKRPEKMITYFGDEDTYIGKSAYMGVGKIYFTHLPMQVNIIRLLDLLFTEKDFKIRQTVINAAGEVGKKDLKIVQHFFDHGLFDQHHSPRNAVIGSIKKMGEVIPNLFYPGRKSTSTIPTRRSGGKYVMASNYAEKNIRGISGLF